MGRKAELGFEVYPEGQFFGDAKLVWITFRKVFIKNRLAEINKEVNVTCDFGDELLQSGIISRAEYDNLQAKAISILKENKG